jgi:hypothetical protein
VSKTPPRCDSCNRRIRRNQHEFILRDFATGQVVGRYHARPDCQAAAGKYIVPGVVLRGTFYHPERCGDDLEFCDAGLSEWAA